MKIRIGIVGLGTVIFALFIGHVVAICLQITKKIDEFFPN